MNHYKNHTVTGSTASKLIYILAGRCTVQFCNYCGTCGHGWHHQRRRVCAATLETDLPNLYVFVTNHRSLCTGLINGVGCQSGTCTIFNINVGETLFQDSGFVCLFNTVNQPSFEGVVCSTSHCRVLTDLATTEVNGDSNWGAPNSVSFLRLACVGT
jgi:hypothetical protein